MKKAFFLKSNNNLNSHPSTTGEKQPDKRRRVTSDCQLHGLRRAKLQVITNRQFYKFSLLSNDELSGTCFKVLVHRKTVTALKIFRKAHERHFVLQIEDQQRFISQRKFKYQIRKSLSDRHSDDQETKSVETTRNEPLLSSQR